jgi:hypothetical protein
MENINFRHDSGGQNQEEEKVEDKFAAEIQTFFDREKETRQEKKPKFYHVSDQHYQIGDVIEGCSSNSFFKDVVFLTDSEKPHYTLLGRNMKNAFIYKVVPLRGVKSNSYYNELASKRVRVVERVGSAKNFLNKEDTSSVKVREHNQAIDIDDVDLKPTEDNHAGKELLRKIEKKYGKSRVVKKKKNK